MLHHTFSRPDMFVMKRTCPKEHIIIRPTGPDLINFTVQPWDKEYTIGKTSQKETAALYGKTCVGKPPFYWWMGEKAFLEMKNGLGIDILMTPMDVYAWVEPLRDWCIKHGVPVIMLTKEGMLSPAMEIKWQKDLDDVTSRATIVTAWSEHHRDVMIKCGIDPSHIRLTGAPKFDYYNFTDMHMNRNQYCGRHGMRPERKKILFISYFEFAYLPMTMFDGTYAKGQDVTRAEAEVSWRNIRTDTEIELVAYARKHPEVDVVVHFHPLHPHGKDPTGFSPGVSSYLPPNIKMFGMDGRDYDEGFGIADHIMHCDVVTGFMSTSMVEAMVCKKPIVYTKWGDIADRDDIIRYDKAGTVLTANERSEYEGLLDRALNNTSEVVEELQPHWDKFIGERIYKADGKSAERVWKAVDEVMEKGLV